MGSIAEFVLRHRRWVLVGWLVVVIAGVMLVNTTNNRLVIDFSLPGQPGTETANQIDREFQAGGKTAPYVITVTLPDGQHVTGNEDAVAKAFAAVQADVPGTRLVDEANTGDKAFRTSDDRTAYAMVFYPFPQSFAEQLPTKPIEQGVQSARPEGAQVGVTGMDALAVGDESGGPGVLTETLFGAAGALIVL